MPEDFTAHYEPRAGTVTLIHHVGPLRVPSTIPLETFQRRQQQWPGFYPEAVRVVRGKGLAHG